MNLDIRNLTKKLHKIKMTKKKLLMEIQHLEMEEEEIIEELKNYLIDKEDNFQRFTGDQQDSEISSKKDNSIPSYKKNAIKNSRENSYYEKNSKINLKEPKKRIKEETESEQEEYQEEKAPTEIEMSEEDLLEELESLEDKKTNTKKSIPVVSKQTPKTVAKAPTVLKQSTLKQKEIEEPEENKIIEKETKNEVKIKNGGGEGVRNLIKSDNFQDRIDGFKTLSNWDCDYSREEFVQDIEIILNEKKHTVIAESIVAFENLLKTKEGVQVIQKINVEKFIDLFLNKFISNANIAKIKKDAESLFISFWINHKNKSDLNKYFLDFLNKAKLSNQEIGVSILLELIKAGRLMDLEFLKDYFNLLESFLGSKSVNLKKDSLNVYKEAYLWMGDELRFYMTQFKKIQIDEMEKYMEKIDFKDMKQMYDEKGNLIKYEAYTYAKAQALPDELQGFGWVENILKLKLWKEKMEKLEEVNKKLKNIIKLNSKTETWPFLDLAKKVMAENIVLNKILVLKILSYIASALRCNFKETGKAMIPVLLDNFKLKNKTFTDQILKTLDKFFCSLTWEDISEEVKESLKNEKSNNKILNIMITLKLMITNPNTVNGSKNVTNLTKLVLESINVKDPETRDSVFELIADLWKKYPDFVEPLLDDIDAKKRDCILKFKNKNN